MSGQDRIGPQRRLGLLQSMAINVTMVVGAGVFFCIPEMLHKLPGPYALLGWLAAGALILCDGLVWSELGAAFPKSGGSYLYLLECYGPKRWGRLMAFLFLWQFLLSGPLEIASGLIAADGLALGLSQKLKEFNDRHKYEYNIEWRDLNGNNEPTSITISPVRAGCIAAGACCVGLLYRRMTGVGRLAVVFLLIVVAAIAWILIEGLVHFDSERAFDFGSGTGMPENPAYAIGQTMVLATYCYLGYYNICYLGDEVCEPRRNIPASIFISALLVIILFIGLHLALLGTVSWRLAAGPKNFNLPIAFMEQVHGEDSLAVQLIILLILGSIFAFVFSGILSYSRIPYCAARSGHFFAAFGRLHPEYEIPHVSLLFVGGTTLLCSLFDFATVINALITARFLIQFVGQCFGLMVLRRFRPHGPWLLRAWLYRLPCGLALACWLYLFVASNLFFIVVSLTTLAAGLVAFLWWSAIVRSWPFGLGSDALGFHRVD